MNPKKTLSYFRARLKSIEFAMEIANRDKGEQERNKALLRNGVFPPELDIEGMIQIKLKEHRPSNEPLNFMELCSFNTWFNLHPEKVAGKEIITSSREFPISIKGTKQDIINTIHVENSKKQKTNSKDFNFQLELKLKTSKTKLKLLKL